MYLCCIKHKDMISIISPLPRDSWGRWNNLDNATNLNDIWQDLNLPADSRLSEYKSREGLHFALYVVSESPETGVLVRLGLAQYKFHCSVGPVTDSRII